MKPAYSSSGSDPPPRSAVTHAALCAAASEACRHTTAMTSAHPAEKCRHESIEHAASAQ